MYSWLKLLIFIILLFLLVEFQSDSESSVGGKLSLFYDFVIPHHNIM